MRLGHIFSFLRKASFFCWHFMEPMACREFRNLDYLIYMMSFVGDIKIPMLSLKGRDVLQFVQLHVKKILRMPEKGFSFYWIQLKYAFEPTQKNVFDAMWRVINNDALCLWAMKLGIVQILRSNQGLTTEVTKKILYLTYLSSKVRHVSSLPHKTPLKGGVEHIIEIFANPFQMSAKLFVIEPGDWKRSHSWDILKMSSKRFQ